MLAAEKKVIKYLEKKYVYICLAILSVFAVVLRISTFDYVSSDMEGYLIGWFGQIEQLGGLRALNIQVGNYSVFYQTLIAIMTYIPVNCIYQYKILSVVFDFSLAFGMCALVYELTGKKSFGRWTYVITLFLPTVFMNSAVWGQCDSIYASFIVWSLLLFIRKKYPLSFAMFGLACAFKLQAVFLLPFFLFAYIVKKDYSVFHFLIIPAVMEAVCIPAMIMGRGWKAAFSVYYYQTESCDAMFFNYPSFWTIFSANNDTRVAYCNDMKIAAIVLTVTVLLLLMIWFFSNNILIDGENILFVSFLIVFSCVLFLPGMHERYGYVYEILAVAIAMLRKKTVPFAVGLLILSCLTYGGELFNGPMVTRLMGTANLIIYGLYVYCLGKEMKEKALSTEMNA